MGVNYSFAEFELKIKKAERAVSAQGVAESLQKVNKLWQRRISLQFATSTNPFGEAWAPSKKSSGRTLVKTSLLSRSFSGDVQGKTLTIGVGGPAAQYASELQNGRTGGRKIFAKNGGALRFALPDGTIIFRKSATLGPMPARQMLPVDSLPTEWESDANKVFEESFEI